LKDVREFFIRNTYYSKYNEQKLFRQVHQVEPMPNEEKGMINLLKVYLDKIVNLKGKFYCH